MVNDESIALLKAVLSALVDKVLRQQQIELKALHVAFTAVKRANPGVEHVFDEILETARHDQGIAKSVDVAIQSTLKLLASLDLSNADEIIGALIRANDKSTSIN